MDVRLHSSPQHHYAVNGGSSQNSRPGEEDLQCLSQEVLESIQFFDETIVSLEESLEEDQIPAPQPTANPYPVRVDGPSPVSHSPMSSLLARTPSPKDQDIIDLVRPEPDLVQTKQPIFSPTSQDFHRMVQVPESHFEMKPRRDLVDSLPSEYTDNHSSYHPPGSIPTPVLIAQKMAENKAGGNSNLLSSSLHRRQSMESEKPPGYSSDLPVKQGPPTSAKPTRFPANINVIHSIKDHQNQSGANVNIHERRSQMLANLAGTSNPLLQEDSQHAADQSFRNTPARSISFKDPTPDISRMEALSKLGLNRSRAMSGGVSPLNKSTTLDPIPGGQPSAKPLEATVPTTTETSTKANVTRPPQSLIHVDRKPEIPQTDSFRRHEDRNPQPSLSSPGVTKSSFNPTLEHKAPVVPPPEVTSLEFNSFGGKSIVVHPTVLSKSEPATSPTSPDPKIIPHALSNPSEFNTYGGKSKVMTPASGTTVRHDLPDILSSHIDKSQTLPAKSEPLKTDLNTFGGKSRTINPSSGGSSEGHAKTFKAPAPTPAPKPHRHTVHVTTPKPAPRASSPEHRRRSVSMFRPQGITVQFSGRGPMNESRREALRKLGLLKDS